MGALVICQIASVVMNGSYGLATGVIFMLVYVAYDLACFRLIDHSQNPELEEGYRVFSGALSVVTILFAVWTATAMMAVASYKKEVADNTSSIKEAETLRDLALESSKKALKASDDKPNLQGMYMDKSNAQAAEASRQQAKIDKLQSETPSDRNAVYEIIGALLGSKTAKIIEGVMMLIGGALIPVLATSLFMLERRLSYKDSPKTQIKRPRKGLKSKEKTKTQSLGNKKSKDITSHDKFAEAQQAVFERRFEKPDRKAFESLKIGGATATKMQQELARQGLLKLGKSGYEYVEKVRAV